MTILLTILYAGVCLFLIMVVLLQTGKRADIAGAFGGGGSQTAFGARGAATMLGKATTISAVLFMVLALALSILSSHRAGRSGSVLEEVPGPASPATAPAPAQPLAPAGAAVPQDEQPAPAPTTPPAEGVPPTDTQP